MKKALIKIFIMSIIILLSSVSSMAQFQILFGNNQVNFFNKVIPFGSDFYTLGSDGDHATISLINNAGQLQWTTRLVIPSGLIDAAIIPSSGGNLMVVGLTLPFDNTNKSLLGIISPTGAVISMRAYDLPGLEGFTGIDDNPLATASLTVVGFFNNPGSANDVVLLNVDYNGIINSAQLFGNSGDNGYFNDVEVLGNGDILMAGYEGTSGVIYHLDASLNLIGGVREPSAFTFNNVIADNNNGFLAVGRPLGGGGTLPAIVRLDANMLPIWAANISGLSSLDQVVQNASTGEIYVVGTGLFGGLNRAIVLKITDSGTTRTLNWARYLEYGETNYLVGSIKLLPTGGIVFVDGREGNPNGLGMSDAFIAVTDSDLTSNCRKDANVTFTEYSPNFDSPDLDFMDDTNLTSNFGVDGQDLIWQKRGACSVLTPVIYCGDIRVYVESDQEARVVGYDGISAEGDEVTLDFLPSEGTVFPVGVTTVVATATDISGATATCTFTITVEKMPYDSMQPPPLFSQEGIFDRVRDRFGNPYRLADIQIPKDSVRSALLCVNSGYFNLYFEPGCGMEGNSTIEVARRDVLCQLYADLSQFIMPASSTVRVNIWVRKIANVPGVPNPVSSGILGVASSFYVMPNGAPSIGGIVDGEIWRTINGGVDSYTSVSSPLIPTGGNGFYHGMVAYNFVNPGINWHTTLSTVTAAGLYDLYSVALHEAVHTLGFASLLRSNGFSTFGSVFPKYFSRYDTYLQSPSNLPLLNNTGNCGTMYNYQFNPAVSTSVLQPNTSNCLWNQTACSTAIKFGGTVTQKIYTPNCFEQGSSLSHMEDLCSLPSPYSNDQYYVMSNANGTGPTFMKRFLKPEEKQVLCDLGYKTSGTYGNTGQSTQITYPNGGCSGLLVAGVNDGITSTGNFAYVTNILTPITLSIALGNSILLNDFQTVSFECLEIVFGGGTINTTSGTDFTYTPTANAGTTLLRYVPVGANGRGNITYVLIRVNQAGCTQNVCNMVGDPGFDQVSNCGAIVNWDINPITSVAFCWEPLSSSPDLFSRTCPIGTSTNYRINAPPNPNTFDGLTSNMHYLGLWANKTTSVEDYESIQTTLATPITQGTYTISFWARMRYANAGNTNILIAASPMTLPATAGISITPLLANPMVITLVPYPNLQVLLNGSWNYLTTTFTYTGTTPLNNLIIANYPGTVPFPNIKYVYIDEVKLISQASIPTFTPPSSFCVTNPLFVLNGTATPPGGIFTGPGVTFNSTSGNYEFDPSIGFGNYVLVYTVTDANNCTTSASASIQVSLPCDVIKVVVNEYDTCCYSIDLDYNCNTPFFSKIEFDILTPGVQFGAKSLMPSWNFCGIPSLTNICISPPTGLIGMGQYNNLFSFCLTNVDQFTPSPQMVKVTYWTVGSAGQDSVACDTVIDFNAFDCHKRCALVTTENIHCIEDSMKYEITVTVQNISSPPFIAHSLSMIGPGLTPNPVPLIPPLANDGTTRTVTYCYTPNPWPDPDGLLILTYGLSDLNGDTTCYGNGGLFDTLVLTACDTCLCLGFQNMNFYYSNGSIVWQSTVFCDTSFIDTLPCIPLSGFYQFEGDYLCSDSCPATVDYEIYSLDLNANIITGTTTTTNIGGNTSHFNLITGFQLISGHYQLILKGHCGSDYCRCVINFFIQDCNPLCPDNLILNPLFESYSQCPTTISNIIETNSWTSPTLGTPDYFNACAAYGSFPDVPNNFAGSQVPHSGTAYAGFIFYRNNTIKEYIETPLSAPLVPGMTYEISFYVSLADESRLAIDNLGAYLSNGPVGPTLNSNPLNFIPHISSPPGIPISDKIGWTQVKGTITPTSGTNYNHLVIGNFVNTNTVLNTGAGYLNDAYYYVDDVSVCKISDTCMCTGFQNMEMYYSNGLSGWQFGFGCNTGAIDTLPCIPPGELYHFKGEFSCSDSCLASANYDIISLASGLSVQNGPLSLVPIGINSYQFDLVSGFNHAPGNYQLVVEGYCGMDSCQCVTEFYIPTCDTCACGSLVWAEVLNVGTAPRPVFCDSTALVIKCKKAGPNFFLHGDMTCHPDTCGNDTVFWKLERPGGLPDLIGYSLSAYPHFNIGISWSAFSKAGNYTLTISRNCGGKVCTCKFNLVQQSCPCACPVLKDVNNGFTAQGNKNSCVRKFKPVKLCPNDMVTWQVNGPGMNNQVVGTSLGINNFQITFPTPGGTYNVCMIVKRIDPLSGDSCFGQFCQKVIIKCKSGSSPKNPTITTCSGGDRLINGDFDQEFIPGQLGEDGQIQNWALFPNFGNGLVLIDSSGASDDGQVVLIGGQNNFAGVFQQVNLQGDSAYLGFYTLNYLQEEAPIGTQLEFRLQSDPVPGSPGQTIYRHVLDTTLLSWVEVSIALPIDFNPSYQFLVICVQNENPELHSIVAIDNIEICTDETVGISDPGRVQEIRIYPNPNTGEFTVDFLEPASIGTSIRIINLAGQVVSEMEMEYASSVQQVGVTMLPQGMYFIQILSKGQVIAVNKFVKQ